MLARRYGWGPETVSALTLEQLEMYLADDERQSRGRPGWIHFDNAYEGLAHARKMQADRAAVVDELIHG